MSSARPEDTIREALESQSWWALPAMAALDELLANVRKLKIDEARENARFDEIVADYVQQLEEMDVECRVVEAELRDLRRAVAGVLDAEVGDDAVALRRMLMDALQETA